MNTRLTKSLAIAALLQNSNPFTDNVVKADQPVHCLREQLYGVWNFHASADPQTVNVFEAQELCTHSVPNKVQLVSADHKFAFAKDDVYRVNIMENYKAEAVYCKNGEKCADQIIPGKWTSIYDQAFNIELDNGLRFITNFRYNIKPELSKDPFTDAQSRGIGRFSQIQSGDYEKFDSQCTKTMVGFIQNIPSKTGTSGTLAQHSVQCFYGVQEKHYDFEKTQAFNTGKVKFNKIVQHKQVAVEDIKGEVPEATTNLAIKKSMNKRQNLHLAHRPSDEMDLLISAVNEADLGWTADVCKYQKHHAKYGAHCDNEKLNLAQTSSKDFDLTNEAAEQILGALNLDQLTNPTQQPAPAPANKKEFGVAGDKAFEAALAKAQKFQKRYGDGSEIPDAELPESLDYRDIDGYDFTSYFRDQGHCGSCYTISFTQVMEARLKLKYGAQPPMLSPQMLMTCNYMNEGCEGGWPHFNVFLAENGHLVSEECAPYKSSTKDDQCSNYQKCKPVSKINKSYLVGGGWGATTEKKMMKEILRNGPINGDFQAPSMFSIYKEGIFSEKGLIGVKKQHAQALFDAQVSSKTDDKTAQKQKEAGTAGQPTDTSLNDKGISWMDMNHSVVIVGWGVDDKTKTRHWIVRNSYGPKWGMNGDFLVQRGNNDFGMEVEQIAFEPMWFEKEQGNASPSI